MRITIVFLATLFGFSLCQATVTVPANTTYSKQELSNEWNKALPVKSKDEILGSWLCKGGDMPLEGTEEQLTFSKNGIVLTSVTGKSGWSIGVPMHYELLKGSRILVYANTNSKPHSSAAEEIRKDEDKLFIKRKDGLFGFTKIRKEQNP